MVDHTITSDFDVNVGVVLSCIAKFVSWNILCPHFATKDFSRPTNLFHFTHTHIHVNLCEHVPWCMSSNLTKYHLPALYPAVLEPTSYSIQDINLFLIFALTCACEAVAIGT